MGAWQNNDIKKGFPIMNVLGDERKTTKSGQTMKIRCCGCDGEKVDARLTNGKEIYPHRVDLRNLPFWICDTCSNYVGCHHKTKNPTQPLGCIPTPEIKKERQRIHRLIDPVWKNGLMDRKAVYAYITERIGWQFHTAKIRSVEEVEQVYEIVRTLKLNLITN
jgi:hypothetical protein